MRNIEQILKNHIKLLECSKFLEFVVLNYKK